MDFRALAQQLYIQFAITRDAPIPLALGIVLAGFVCWRLTKWRYEARVRKLRKVVEHRESEILLLRARGGAVAAAAPTPVTEAVDQDEQARANARRKALRIITNGIEGALTAVRTGEPAAVERATPNVWLALLAAQRTYGITLPNLSGDPTTNLVTGRRLLELIRPCLMVGDDDEARRVAAEFLRRSGIAEADQKPRAAAA